MDDDSGESIEEVPVVERMSYCGGVKYINGRAPAAPPYLSEHCIPSPVLTRAGICVPPTVTYLPYRVSPLNTYGRRAFSDAGPMAWNSLPDFIRDPASSTNCFGRLLKTYLFARY